MSLEHATRLKDLGATYGGLTGKSKADFGRGDGRYITFLEVINNTRLRGRDLQAVRIIEGENQHSVLRDDLLFNGSSETPEEVALSAVVDFDTDAHTYLNSFCFGYRLKRRDLADPTYLAYLFRSSAGRQLVAALAQGATRYNIAKTKFLELTLDLPTPEKQCEIAAALTDVDDLIASLGQLIIKKQAIKQGVMQRLFTHRADRQSFASLGAVTTWLSGGTPDRSVPDYWVGTIPWISATTLKNLEVATSDQSVTPAAVKAGSKMAPLGSTLILVRGSALHSEIRASLVTASVCFNQDVKALVPLQKLVPKFLTYSIHGNADKLLRLVTSAGNTAGVLDTQVVKSFEIWVPKTVEQEQVVAVLDDFSHEIDALQERLTKAISIKQGMMHELLANRTRPPVKESAA